MSIEAMKLALKALEYYTCEEIAIRSASFYIKEAIEQAEKQEPVAWMYVLKDKVSEVTRKTRTNKFNLEITSPFGREGIDYAPGMVVEEYPLYTAPPEHVNLDAVDRFYENKLKLKEKSK
jgi:hypothetical protein